MGAISTRIEFRFARAILPTEQEPNVAHPAGEASPEISRLGTIDSFPGGEEPRPDIGVQGCGDPEPGAGAWPPGAGRGARSRVRGFALAGVDAACFVVAFVVSPAGGQRLRPGLR